MTVLSEAEIKRLAQRQLADYDTHSPGHIFDRGSGFFSLHQAYELQRRVAELRIQRGELVAGYKLGCVSKAIQRQLGLNDPVMGYVFNSELHKTGTVLDPACYECLSVEGEFAFRLRENLPDPQRWLQNLTEIIASVFVVIELHHFVFRAAAPTVQELIANNTMHAGVVLPERENSEFEPDQPLDEEITVIHNGKELGTAAGKSLPGGPVGSLRRLAEMLDRLGRKFEGGDIILTGSPLGLYRVLPGDHVQVRCQSAQPVEMRVGMPTS